MTVSDLNVSDDTVVAVHPDEDDPARPILTTPELERPDLQFSNWNLLVGTALCRRCPAVPLECVRQDTVRAA